jgi:hypothetical protein
MNFEELVGQDVKVVAGLHRCHGKSYAPRVVELLNTLGLDEDITIVDLKKHLVDMGAFFDEPCKYSLILRDDYFSQIPDYYSEGTLVVPASNKTKGSHAYPWYHGGKW